MLQRANFFQETIWKMLSFTGVWYIRGFNLDFNFILFVETMNLLKQITMDAYICTPCSNSWLIDVAAWSSKLVIRVNDWLCCFNILIKT